MWGPFKWRWILNWMAWFQNKKLGHVVYVSLLIHPENISLWNIKKIVTYKVYFWSSKLFTATCKVCTYFVKKPKLSTCSIFLAKISQMNIAVSNISIAKVCYFIIISSELYFNSIFQFFAIQQIISLTENIVS